MVKDWWGEAPEQPGRSNGELDLAGPRLVLHRLACRLVRRSSVHLQAVREPLAPPSLYPEAPRVTT